VFDDADLDAAVEGLMAAKFRNGGQTCVCPNRVYVHGAVHDRFLEKLAGRVGALKVGPATRADSQIGPMINARAVAKIERHVADAVARGAKLIVGGRPLRNAVADGGSAKRTRRTRSPSSPSGCRTGLAFGSPCVKGLEVARRRR